MTATKNKPTTPINTCPCCGKTKPLAIIAASDGREWVNAACIPCGMAMDETDKWTFYAGGTSHAHILTERRHA